MSPISTQSQIQRPISTLSSPSRPATTPTAEQWLEFGKDACSFVGSLAEGAVGAVAGAAIVGTSSAVAGLTNIPRALDQVWSEARSTSADNVPDYLLSRGAAAIMTFPIAAMPIVLGTCGVVVGALGGGIQAQSEGLKSAVGVSLDVAGAAQKTASEFDYRICQ